MPGDVRCDAPIVEQNATTMLRHMTTLSYSWLGRQPYTLLWQRLQTHAAEVAAGAAGEILFCCEHEPVYTTGRRGIDNRLHAELPAPVVQSDRGGEMTFHGPGQIMLYPVIDLRRRGIGVKAYVHLLEQACIDLLAASGIRAERRCGYPGVWTGAGKIAALGVRVSRGVAYHGMALNVAVAPHWFAAINPCGMQRRAVSIIECIDTAPALPELAGHWRRCFESGLRACSHIWSAP